MKCQPFDSGVLFIPACERWKSEAGNDPDQECLGDMLRIRTLTRKGQAPAVILHYFGLQPVGLANAADDDRSFDRIGDIQLQVFEEMLALTGKEYRLDWSRRDGAFCLWYRDRDHRRDAESTTIEEYKFFYPLDNIAFAFFMQ